MRLLYNLVALLLFIFPASGFAYTLSWTQSLDYCEKLSFTSGSEEPEPGDTLAGATSGATGTVRWYPSLSTGAWDDTDAAGDVWLTDVTGTWEAENVNLSGSRSTTDESFTSDHDTPVSLDDDDLTADSVTVTDTSNGAVADESFASDHDTPVSLDNDNLTANSVTVNTPDGETTYTEDDDYTIDYDDGTITVLSTGDMADATEYHIDYDYTFLEDTDYTIEYDNGTITVLSTGDMADATEYHIDYTYTHTASNVLTASGDTDGGTYTFYFWTTDHYTDTDDPDYSYEKDGKLTEIEFSTENFADLDPDTFYIVAMTWTGDESGLESDYSNSPLVKMQGLIRMVGGGVSGGGGSQ